MNDFEKSRVLNEKQITEMARNEMLNHKRQMQEIAKAHHNLIGADVDKMFSENGFESGGLLTVTGFFFMKFDISKLETEGKSFAFTGSGGGLGLGTGTAGGTLVSWVPLEELLGACSFEFHLTPVYYGLNFFNESSVRIATFNAGGVGIVSGIGGGKGDFYLT